MTKKYKRYIALLFLYIEFFLSFISPLSPLIESAIAATKPEFSFTYINNESLQVQTTPDVDYDYAYYYIKEGVLENAKGELKPGDDTLFVGTKSGEDKNRHQFDYLVFKVSNKNQSWQRSYHLVKQNNQLQAKEITGTENLELSKEEKNWLVWEPDAEGRTAETRAAVKEQQSYEFPFNDKVTVKFSKLPANSSTLKIREIELKQELAEKYGAEKAYDITTNMADGTFEFDLSLPKPEGVEDAQVRVFHAEDEDKLAAETEEIEKVIDGEERINLGEDKLEIKRLDHLSTFFVSGALAEEGCNEGQAWTNKVEKAEQGNLNNGGAVTDPERTDADAALGADDGEFYSLGFGGSLTLSFEYPVEDGEGADLSFYEITNNRDGYPIETALVEVSRNGSDWVELGEVSNKTTDGISYLDISTTGYTWIQYVRLTDTTESELHDGSADGYDVDSVGAEYGLCEQRSIDCGNGVLDEGEACDYGELNGQSSCSLECELVTGCRDEMLSNGGFETPAVEHSKGWNAYGNSEVPGWTAEWYDAADDGRPEPQIEIQAGVNSWAEEGNQYVELDSDWQGADGAGSGEAASISLSQSMAVMAGYEYQISWNYAPRPDHADNQLTVSINGEEVFTSENISGMEELEWLTETYTYTSMTNEVITITFTETGTPDSFGMFLDNVSVECLGLNNPAEIVFYKVLGEKDSTDQAKPFAEENSWNLEVSQNQEVLGAIGNYTGTTQSVFDETGDYQSIEVAPGEYNLQEEVQPESAYQFSWGRCMDITESVPNNGSYYMDISRAEGIQHAFGPDAAGLTAKTDVPGNWDTSENEYGEVSLGAGQRIYCVLYNKPATTDVKVCKYDANQEPLSGWQVLLKEDEPVDSVEVIPDGESYSSSELAEGNYILTASGTYEYRGTSGLLVDPGYSQRSDSDGYEGPYYPWINTMELKGALGVMVNNKPTNWGEYNEQHKYSLPFLNYSEGMFEFSVYDNFYTDNVGSLKVDVYAGWAGVTGEDGCYTFENVPYGEYIAEEINQFEYQPVDGLTQEVPVGADTEPISFTNEYVGKGELKIKKYICEQGEVIDETTFRVGEDTYSENEFRPTETGMVYGNEFNELGNETFSGCQLGEEIDFAVDHHPEDDLGYGQPSGPVEEVDTFTTDSNGTIEISDLSIEGRYEVRETVEEERILGFACYRKGTGHGNTSNYGEYALMNEEDEAYCIAFNKPEKGLIKGKKYHDINMDGEMGEGETGLSNWQIVVHSTEAEPVGEYYVDAQDQSGVSTSVLSAERYYLFEAEGIWENTNNRLVDAEYYSDNSWSSYDDMESDPTRGDRQLDLVINDQNIDWGTFNNSHLYKTIVIGEDEPVNLRIYDEDNTDSPAAWYADNEGGLTVRVYDITDEIITTDESGSYETAVSPGEYQVLEINQAGWMQTAPANPSYCHFDVAPESENECNFGNVNARGSIQGRKYYDVNNNGDFDDIEKIDENRLDDWAINLYDGDWNLQTSMLTGDDNTPSGEVLKGQYRFENLLPGTYYVCEEMQEEWMQTEPSSETGVLSPDGETYCHTVELSAGEAEVGVQFGNIETYGTIQGRKYYDVDHNGDFDQEEKNAEGDPNRLDDWTIYLLQEVAGEYTVVDTVLTGDNGTNYGEVGKGQYRFQVEPGEYLVCEEDQTGWVQSEPAEGLEFPDITEQENNTICHSVSVGYGEDVNGIQFGNYESGELIIMKSNNTGGSALGIGDIATFSITLTAEDGPVFNVQTFDLPSDGFEYVQGSETITKNGVPLSGFGFEEYSSPGKYILGDMLEGEEVVISVDMEVTDEVEPGEYRDLAWAYGDNEVIASSVVDGDGYIEDEHFVGTDVVVEDPEDPEKDVNVEEKEVEKEVEVDQNGQVLGAADQKLPATGADNWILAFALVLIAGGIVASLREKPGKKIVVLVLFLGCLLFPVNANAQIANSLSLRVSQPETPANKPFKVEYVVMDMEDNTIEVDCQLKKQGAANFVLLSTEELQEGGDNSTCVISETDLNNGSGQYQVKVIATAEDGETKEETVSVDYDSEAPDQPAYIEKKQNSGCEYEVKFKTADDGQTEYVEVYRSEDKDFVIGPSTRIKTVSIDPDEEHSFTHTLYGDDCGDSYYALRSFDSAGNYSDPLVEEIEDIVIKEIVIESEESDTEETAPLVAGSGADVPAAGQGTDQEVALEAEEGVEGEEDSTEEETMKETTTEEKSSNGEVLGAETRKLSWHLIIPAVLAAVVIGFVFFSQRE